jgi:hypothetical protein
MSARATHTTFLQPSLTWLQSLSLRARVWVGLPHKFLCAHLCLTMPAQADPESKPTGHNSTAHPRTPTPHTKTTIILGLQLFMSLKYFERHWKEQVQFHSSKMTHRGWLRFLANFLTTKSPKSKQCFHHGDGTWARHPIVQLHHHKILLCPVL